MVAGANSVWELALFVVVVADDVILEIRTMSTPQKRKKWSEGEERTLIDKYGEMVLNGSLAKMKTREKKFRPIALFVNSMHNVRDSIAFPWQWSWKDVSTKVQNMRHQYLLVKQKIKKPELAAVGSGCGGMEEFDWEDGVSYWSNFLRYKEVFGDAPLVLGRNLDGSLMDVMNNDENGGSSRGTEMVDFGNLGHSGEEDFGGGIDCGEDGVLGSDLGFEYNGDDGEEDFHNGVGGNRVREHGDNGFVYEEIEANGSEVRKRKRDVKGFEKKAACSNFLAKQLSRLKEMEKGFEKREVELEQERKRQEKEREKMWEEWSKERATREKVMEESRKQRILEWEAFEKESAERERRRREESSAREREWEERMNIRRSEWKKQMDNMLDQHRAEMGQAQSRILHEQQNLTNQLLGIVSQLSGHSNGLSDHTGQYIAQLMQSLHHVNGIVHDDTRVEGNNQEDQFIVD